MSPEADMDLDWYYATKPKLQEQLAPHPWFDKPVEKCKTCARVMMNAICAWCLDQEEGDE
jgi:recombinational DNA repair protein RecR